VQKDFIDGSLALKHCPAKEDGNEVVPLINELLSQVPFDSIVYTQDWHPVDHISFYENRTKHKLKVISLLVMFFNFF
jgi:nicotinamidase-related amidase